VLTQCPNCDTTFRVTSEILRVAQGQVRCGRCETQFDALARLIEEEGDADAEPEAELEQDDADLTLSEPEIEEEEEYAEEEQQDYVEVRRTSPPRQLARADSSEEWVEFDDLEAQTEAETIDVDADMDTDPGVTNPDEFEDDAVAVEEVEEDAVVNEPISARSSYPRERSERRIPSQPVPAIGRLARQFEDTDQFELTRPRSPRLPTAAVWKYLAAPLSVLFAFQILNHYSAPLARHPRLGPMVSGFYRMFGIKLIPDWDLRAYEIKGWRVVSDPGTPGTLKVRARVRNRAAFPQPYPLIKLVLEDRYGGLVRAREFEPIEYLEKAPPPNSLLAPQQQVTATINIVDPGPDAEGFRFDVCLQGNNGSVCGDDLPDG